MEKLIIRIRFMLLALKIEFEHEKGNVSKTKY